MGSKFSEPMLSLLTPRLRHAGVRYDRVSRMAEKPSLRARILAPNAAFLRKLRKKDAPDDGRDMISDEFYLTE